MSLHYILLWSGGFDSTAILLDMRFRLQPDDILTVVSCELKNANNCKEDKEARDRIKTIICSEEKYKKIADVACFYESKIDLELPHDCCGMQAPHWATLSAISAPLGSDRKVCWTFGYIKGDDFWHFSSDFETSIKDIYKMAGGISENQVWYPLEWETKESILPHYVRAKEIFDLLSWGGDSHSTKLKEKCELEESLKQLIQAYTMGVSDGTLSTGAINDNNNNADQGSYAVY